MKRRISRLAIVWGYPVAYGTVLLPGDKQPVFYALAQLNEESQHEILGLREYVETRMAEELRAHWRSTAEDKT